MPRDCWNGVRVETTHPMSALKPIFQFAATKATQGDRVNTVGIV